VAADGVCCAHCAPLPRSLLALLRKAYDTRFTGSIDLAFRAGHYQRARRIVEVITAGDDAAIDRTVIARSNDEAAVDRTVIGCGSRPNG
jgi:hypothetical protein